MISDLLLFFNWLQNNIEWIFSGIGVTIIAGIISFLKKSNEQKNPSSIKVINVIKKSFNDSEIKPSSNSFIKNNDTPFDLEKAKLNTKILFVDDDTKFQVVNILKNAGWINTKIIKDVNSIDEPNVKNANILFIDIQGVGKKLMFKDEGLGLALSLKRKYPAKKLIIYSAETVGERFHEAFKLADDRIAKDADPYEFQRIVEAFAEELHLQ